MPKRVTANINNKLRLARRRNFWSMEDAAEAVGVCVTTYWNWENRRQEPHPSSLALLCKTFGVTDPKDLGF